MRLHVALGMVVFTPFISGFLTAQAQPVVYGADGSAAFGGPTLPSSERVVIDSTTQCPTSTFSIAGFGRNADNWGKGSLSSSGESFDRSSGSSGFGNYGVAAGISVPFASAAIKACNELAVSSARRRQSQRELEFLANCKIIQDKISLSELSGISKQQFPEAHKCLGVNFKKSVQTEESAMLAQCFEWQGKGIDFEKIDKETLKMFPSLGPCKNLRFTPPTQRIITEGRGLPTSLSPARQSNVNEDGIPVTIQINQ
jgi:hypothetical protein